MLYDRDCPTVLREFLSYHENIKGQSPKTVSEYYLDLRMFLRFCKLVKHEMPYDTDLETIPIRDVDLDFIKAITLQNIYDFLSFLANDRVKNPDSAYAETGIGASARARKLSAIKSFYKYLTVRTKQLSVNPVQDLEFPKLRKSLPKYLTLEQSKALLSAVAGRNQARDYAILMIFLNLWHPAQRIGRPQPRRCLPGPAAGHRQGQQGALCLPQPGLQGRHRRVPAKA